MHYESVTTHKVRLRGLIAELEAEEGAEQGGGGGRSYVLLHLRALQDEVGEAMGAAAGAGGGGEAAAEEAAGEDAALQAEALVLSESNLGSSRVTSGDLAGRGTRGAERPRRGAARRAVPHQTHV